MTFPDITADLQALMPELRGRLSLPFEPLHGPGLRGDLRRQHLQRHRSRQRFVARLVDRPHRPSTEEPDDAVRASQEEADERVL